LSSLLPPPPPPLLLLLLKHFAVVYENRITYRVLPVFIRISYTVLRLFSIEDEWIRYEKPINDLEGVVVWPWC